MTITLTDSITDISVSFDANQDYKTQTMENKSRTRTIGGKDIYYTWMNSIGNTDNAGNYRSIEYKLEFLPFSDSLQINEWWENQTYLFVSPTEFKTVTGLTEVMISNRRTPIDKVQSPYTDLYEGTIKLLSVTEQTP
jgi:hypothetical protein